MSPARRRAGSGLTTLAVKNIRMLNTSHKVFESSAGPRRSITVSKVESSGDVSEENEDENLAA
jgi:hypothetical protein